MEQYTQELFLAPLFKFGEFFESGLLADCEIHVHQSMDDPEYQIIRAHRLVLANSSDFFHNSFTSGMIETETGVVDVYTNPNNLFPVVVKWMYDGSLAFDPSQIMSLLSIAHNYGIRKLDIELNKVLEKNITPETILSYVQQCFDNELSDELKGLEPYLAKYLMDIPIGELSDALDVATFARVLEKSSLTNEQKVPLIREFLGDWDPSDEEKDALFGALKFDSQFRRLVTRDDKWLPMRFLKTVK